MIAGHRVGIPADDLLTVQFLVYPPLLVLRAETASCGEVRLVRLPMTDRCKPRQAPGQHNRRTICDGAGRQIGEKRLLSCRQVALAGESRAAKTATAAATERFRIEMRDIVTLLLQEARDEWLR
jgi:hypothetical protein